MKQWHWYAALFVMFTAAALWALAVDTADKKRDAVWECVWSEKAAQGFVGDAPTSWDLFAPGCVEAYEKSYGK